MNDPRQSVIAIVFAFLVAVSMGVAPMGALADEEIDAGINDEESDDAELVEETGDDEEIDDAEFEDGETDDEEIDEAEIEVEAGDDEEIDEEEFDDEAEDGEEIDDAELDDEEADDEEIDEEAFDDEADDEEIDEAELVEEEGEGEAGGQMPETSSGYVPPDRGEPDLSVGLSDNKVSPGITEELEFQITNDGEITAGSGQGVTDAQSVTVEMDDDGPFDSQVDEVPIGPVQDGSVSEAVFPVSVPTDIDAGEYDVTLEVSYTYAETIGTDGSVDRERNTESFDITVEVPDEPRFDVTDVTTDVEPGASGDATIEIENTGTEAANETRATITGGGGVVVDGEAAQEVLGDIEPGDSATAIVNVQVNEAASGGEKPLDLEFTYRDSNGVQQEAEPVTASLAPAGEQQFSIQNLEDDLAVGYDGDVSGQVHNDGPHTIDDAVLVVEPMSESLFIEDTYYALPEIEPGETADFRFPTDVSGQADGGDRQLQFSVEYTGGDNSPLEDGPHAERVVVEDYQDEFAIEGDNISVPQDGTEEFSLEITNDRSETLSNIDAMLYTSGELDTDNDEAFVDELGPGETVEITFDVSASDQATAETHPVELDFQYDTERGDTTLSDTYQHPVEVVAAEDDGGGITGTLVGILGALTVAGVGITLWWRRG